MRVLLYVIIRIKGGGKLGIGNPAVGKGAREQNKVKGDFMASSIVHLAITNELAKRVSFTDTSRLKFGAVVVDAGEGGNITGESHMKVNVMDGKKRTYDFDKYREMFGNLMLTDDLYMGYYLHLVQDSLYRHYVYDIHHWNPRIPGNVERLHKDYEALIPMLAPAIEESVRTISAYVEVSRKIACLEDEQTALNDEQSTFTDDSTGASLSLIGEQISLTSMDGDGNIRTNAEATVNIQTGKLSINTTKADGTLIDDSYVSIHTGDVSISTVVPTLTEGAENPTDGDYATGGGFRVSSKEVSFTAVDYNMADGEYTESSLTADSKFYVRMQDVDLQATDTEGNSTGSFTLVADKMKMTAADKDGNQTGSIDMKALDVFLSSKDKDGTATGAMTLTAKDVSLLSIDKDYKALGQVVVNGKDVHVKAMDLDEKGQDSSLTSGGNMVLVADNMYIGRTKSDSQSSTLLVSSDKTAIFGKTTAEMQQGDAKAVVQLTGGNVALSGSKAEFYGDNTINGKSDFKADVTMKKATADNIEAKTSFKSKNISDGIAVPGAPSTAKLSAKLSEDDAPTSTEIKLGIVEEEGEGDGNGGGTE